MRKPIVQLKKLSFFEGHDGYGMNADVWIDGVKCMHVYDFFYKIEVFYCLLESIIITINK